MKFRSFDDVANILNRTQMYKMMKSSTKQWYDVGYKEIRLDHMWGML